MDATISSVYSFTILIIDTVVCQTLVTKVLEKGQNLLENIPNCQIFGQIETVGSHSQDAGSRVPDPDSQQMLQNWCLLILINNTTIILEISSNNICTLAHCDWIMINYTNTLQWYNHTQILHINRRYEGDELCSELFINLYIITTNVKLTYRLEWAAKCKGNNNKNKINENIELYSQNTMTYSQTYKIYVFPWLYVSHEERQDWCSQS